MINSVQLSTTYDYALAYNANGFSILCLKPKSKEPAIASRKTFSLYTPTKEQLENWFVNSDNNIAIITGKVSSIFAIDIDGEEANEYFLQKIESLSDKQLVQSIKDTMKIKTGSGNTNLIFRFDPEEFLIDDDIPNNILWKNSSNPNGHSEIRLRGECSYVVAPPSIHF